jgi:hypothetical protein
MTTRLLLALALVGCSATVPETMPGDSADAGTTSTGGGGDPSPGSNTPPGGGVPDSITIAGQAIVQDQTTATPQSDVAIGIYATGNDTTPLATAMTDASGNYSRPTARRSTATSRRPSPASSTRTCIRRPR